MTKEELLSEQRPYYLAGTKMPVWYRDQVLEAMELYANNKLEDQALKHGQAISTIVKKNDELSAEVVRLKKLVEEAHATGYLDGQKHEIGNTRFCEDSWEDFKLQNGLI